jgi:DNA polymerase-3 subunit delta'
VTEIGHNWGLVGHAWAVDFLTRAITSNYHSHAYLVTGPRHVGKNLLALRLAQALNCEQQTADPCGICRTCKRIAKNNYPDVRIASMATQAAAAKGDEGARQRDLRIDTVRTWLADITLRPYEGRRRVFILDDVERLTDGAANAMLKVLEEPPPYATILLVAHTAGDVMATIVSRCQRIKLRPVERPAIADWLVAQSYDAQDAERCAAWSDGMPGLALRYAANPDESIAIQQQIDELLGLSQRSFSECVKWVEERNKAFRAGEQNDIYAMLTLWQRWWRDVLVTAAGTHGQLTWVDRQADVVRVARGTGVEAAALFLHDLALATKQLRENANPQLVLEHLVLRLPDRR